MEFNETHELTEDEREQAKQEREQILNHTIPRSMSFEALQELNKARLAEIHKKK